MKVQHNVQQIFKQGSTVHQTSDEYGGNAGHGEQFSGK